MSTVERNILTIIEPTIELDELSVPDAESGTENSDNTNSTDQIKVSKLSSVLPLVRINQYEIQGDRLESFKLKNSGFYPTCRIVFSDTDGMFLARFFPKDGDLIQVNIRSQGEETTFKPIRIDFTVTSITPSGGGFSSAPRFIVEGRMNVPNLFTETCSAYKDTSFNTLLTVAEELKLGYASNVEETNDEMIWLNPTDTVDKFIQDTVSNSYLDDESFFTAYIDPYYYLTFVDVNKFFGQDGEVDLSKTFYSNSPDTYGRDGAPSESDEYPNFLSNKVDMQGTARGIFKYHMVNESGNVSKNNGYKRYAQYWNLLDNEFISEFVDPLITDSPGTIPATKGRIIEGEENSPRDQQVRYKYLGTQSENVHEEYMYSVILNYQNLIEVTKLGMVVELETVNPALVRYSRVYCLIVETAEPVKETLLSPSEDENGDNPNQQERNLDADIPDDSQNENGVVNEFLSGFYVISGMEYTFAQPGPLRMKLFLQRREFTPST